MVIPDLRVGLLGYGIAGRVFHAPLIASTPGLALAGIVTSSSERRKQAQSDYPEARTCSTPEELLREDLDLVVVATPNATHVPFALAVVEAGIPVVVDKPLAPSAAEARRVLAAAAAHDVPVTVFQNRRWDSDFRTLSRLVEERAVGAVTRFESRYERWEPGVSDGWRESSAPQNAGGLLYDLGAHLIDQAVHLFGPVSSVHAELSYVRPRAEVDDDVFLALKHAGGVRSHLWASMTAAQHGPRFSLFGDKSAYTVGEMDGQEEALMAGRRPGQPGWGEVPASAWGRLGTVDAAEAVPSEPGAYEAFYEILRDALRGQGPLPVDPQDSVYVLEVIEAAFRSHKTGQTVSLEVTA